MEKPKSAGRVVVQASDAAIIRKSREGNLFQPESESE